jgi:hypothetical protein
MRFLSAACGSSVAGAAIAFGGFAAVGARALAIVNEFAAPVAMRQFGFFFYHSVRLCHTLLSFACELSFRKRKPVVHSAFQPLNKGAIDCSKPNSYKLAK